jgi:hypothetical protein
MNPMTKRLLLLSVACAIFAGLLLAADISGNWSGTMAFGDQQIPLSYTFKQDGDKLTGAVHGPQGDLPLIDGKVDGDKVTFAVSVDMGGNATRFVSSGTIKGEEIALDTKAGDFASTMTLKRAK